jgi:alkylation response protein AidB-like acyl-CoA dehydrogenase
VESVVAYPLATLVSEPSDAILCVGHAAAAIRRRALIGIAAKAAGLMRGALDQTVQYVKERRLVGNSPSSFQAVQHRLAACAQRVHACRSLALGAAFEDSLKA